MNPKIVFSRFVQAVFGITVLAISQTQAVNIWDGGASDNNWTSALNWDNDVAPTTAGVTFRGDTRTTINNDRTAATVSAGYTFSNNGLTGFISGFTLNGNSVTLGGNIITTANIAGSTITNTINHDLILSATRIIYTNQMSNTVQHNLTIDGAISESVALSGITKSGYGTLTLTGANSYTGLTTITAGTLVLDMQNGGALSSSSGLATGANAQFGTFLVKGASTGSSAQTMGAFSTGNNAGLKIVIDPNGGTGTTLTLGDAWTIGSGTYVLIDYSSANVGTRQVVTAGATTGATLSNGIYGKVLVKDSAGVVGFATRAAGVDQAITRYDDTTGTTLLGNSNSNITNFTTLNTVYTSGVLNWTGVTARSVNSLTIDTTNNGGIIDLGVSTNTLTLTAGAILFKGANDATLTGGRIGASNADNQIHQTGTGTLTINSLIGTGSGLITKNGSGTLVLGAENTHSGSTAVNEGILKLGAAGNGTNTPLGTAVGGTRVNSGGTLDMNGFTLSTAEAVTLNGYGHLGGGALANSGTTAASWSGALTIQTASSIIASGGDINLTNTTTVNIGQGLTIGGTKDTTISFAMSGTVANGSSARLIKEGSGTLNLAGTVASTYAGGTAVTGGALVFRNTNAKSASGTHTFDAGTTLGLGVGSTGFFDSTDITNAFSGTMTGNLSNVTVTATTSVGIDTTAGDFTHSADITGSPTKGLTKLGVNKLILSGANTYTGPTTVKVGTLAVNGSITSAVTVQTGAILQGSGSITGSVTIQSGGFLSTGNSIESLTITGNLTQNAGSTFAYEINNDAALAVAGDLTAVSGNVTLDSGAVLTLTELGIGSWGVGEKLTLLSYSGALSGLFTYNSATLADDSTFDFSGATWQFNYNDTVAGSNYTGDLLGSNFVTMTVIPEPKAALLGALGILLLLRRRR